MRSVSRYLLVILVCGFSSLRLTAQCPARPAAGTVVQDALTLSAKDGVLKAGLTLRHSVDNFGYTHYCMNYKSANGEVEAPTLRLNQGDKLDLEVKDRIAVDTSDSMGAMDGMALPEGKTCGDGGTMTVNSTNVHFHGLNVSPNCHQDDVLTTLI